MESKYYSLQNKRDYSPFEHQAEEDPQQPSEVKRDTKQIVFIVILGQILAFINIIANLFAQTVERNFSIKIPLVLVFGYYLLFFVFYLIVFRRIAKPKFNYILIALFDSQANFFNAYSFSSVNFNFPFIVNMCSALWTMLLTCLFIRAYKFKWTHYLGVMLAVIGVSLSIVSTSTDFDVILENNIGMIYSLISSICYSCSYVIQEKTFQSGQDIYDFFPWLGFLGLIFSGLEGYFFGQFSYFYYTEIGNAKIYGFIAGFAIALTAFFTFVPFYIKRCSAGMYNVSIVSQIFYSYLVELILFHSDAKPFYFYIAFGVILIGIVIYALFPPFKYTPPAIEENRRSLRSQAPVEEYSNRTVKMYKDQSLTKNAMHIINDTI